MEGGLLTPTTHPPSLTHNTSISSAPSCETRLCGSGSQQAPFRESISAQPKVLPVDRWESGTAKTRQKTSIIVCDWHFRAGWLLAELV